MNAAVIDQGLILLILSHSTFPIISLWPAYHIPQNPQDTISQPTLKQFNKYPEVMTDALEWLRTTDTHNNSISIPTLPSFKQSSLQDCIEGKIVTPKPHVQLEQFKPALLHNKYHCLPSIKKVASQKQRLAHICEKTIATTSKQKTTLPKSKLKCHHHGCICLICTITKAKNRNKGKRVDTTVFNNGEVMHLDITFFDVPSIRGFNSALNIIDAKSRKLWGFLSSAKTVSCRVIKNSIMAIAKEGKAVAEIRNDEEGAIARSATFINMIVDKVSGIRITTTGGYVSWMNSKVKRQNETLKNATIATLMDANKENQY
eukprot:7495975-Ditylum_brightwellii.AAC.1